MRTPVRRQKQGEVSALTQWESLRRFYFSTYQTAKVDI